MAKSFAPEFEVLPRPYGHSADGVMLGAGGPRFRVKAWRQPNEDGSNREALYLPYRGSLPSFWDGQALALRPAPMDFSGDDR